MSVLPFRLEQDDTVIDGDGVTSTVEDIEGLLRLEEDRLVVQWRRVRTIERVGSEIRSDRELEPVREVVLPLAGIAAVTVRASRWPWVRKARLVLTASDLRTFETLAGPDGLRLDNVAELVLEVRPDDRLQAREFAADVQLAVAERLTLGERPVQHLPPPERRQ